MSTFEQALRLAGAGRYSDAITALDASRAAPPIRVQSEVLRLELLERTRPRAQIRDFVQKVLASKAGPDERSRCEIVLGRMDRESGDRQSAIDHFQRAVAI